MGRNRQQEDSDGAIATEAAAGGDAPLATREMREGRTVVVVDITEATLAAAARALEAEALAHSLERAERNRRKAACLAGLEYRTFLNRLGRLRIAVSVLVRVQ